jgi:hypothetical protein
MTARLSRRMLGLCQKERRRPRTSRGPWFIAERRDQLRQDARGQQRPRAIAHTGGEPVDAVRFDGVIRCLGETYTRRRAVGALAGLAGLGVGTGFVSTTEARRRRRCRPRCAADQKCIKRVCCTPTCTGNTCGSDGCGGTCKCSTGGSCCQGTCYFGGPFNSGVGTEAVCS